MPREPAGPIDPERQHSAIVQRRSCRKSHPAGAVSWRGEGWRGLSLPSMGESASVPGVSRVRRELVFLMRLLRLLQPQQHLLAEEGCPAGLRGPVKPECEVCTLVLP